MNLHHNDGLKFNIYQQLSEFYINGGQFMAILFELGMVGTFFLFYSNSSFLEVGFMCLLGCPYLGNHPQGYFQLEPLL
jgi:hypothetical protein